ncbi:hypothetical protein PISL3812_03404 [Talaromyces islandicus]|uniref:CSN8/PSMD8/EIF3K domain-containing protein n=1 Tax=Talaromyces islandicus TaxID=28573 RepID=A0A0U1LSN5_TALIS|nr:hypothetical protein PISL3812_03404 [Talaromyces islandicus]
MDVYSRPRPSRKQDNNTNAASRLRPVADALDAVGFPSKGDKTLLEHKAQRGFYDKIVDRYMRFCARNSHDLEAAWASLPASASADATKNPPASFPTKPRAQPPSQNEQNADSLVSKTAQLSLGTQKPTLDEPQKPPAAELSTLLMALRKLREALLATASTTPIAFQQQVHIFSVRFSILARHPPSYFASLRYLLESLHTPTYPLTPPQLTEFTSYLILDYACRQNSFATAYTLLVESKQKLGFQSPVVEQVLTALTHDNWVSFWRIHKGVDGYMRAVMGWATENVIRQALKAVGRTYLSVNLNWLLTSCTGDEDWTWESLVEKERLGWDREGDTIVIRRPKPRQ